MSGYVMKSSIGTVRRLQALGWLGWTRAEIYRRAGLYLVHGGKTLGSLVRESTADAIARVYDDLWDCPPLETEETKSVRSLARELGWAPPLAWDDETLDDPEARPEGLGNVPPLTVREQVIELLEIGCSVREIPSRVGRRSLNAVLGCIRDRDLKAELTRRAS